MSSNIYRITIRLVNPHERYTLHTSAPTAIDALHAVQTSLPRETLHRIKSANMEIFNPVLMDFEMMGNFRTVAAWLQYVHSLP